MSPTSPFYLVTPETLAQELGRLAVEFPDTDNTAFARAVSLCAQLDAAGHCPRWIMASGGAVEVGLVDSVKGLSWIVAEHPFDDWVNGDGANGWVEERLDSLKPEVPQVLAILQKHLGRS